MNSRLSTGSSPSINLYEQGERLHKHTLKLIFLVGGDGRLVSHTILTQSKAGKPIVAVVLDQSSMRLWPAKQPTMTIRSHSAPSGSSQMPSQAEEHARPRLTQRRVGERDCTGRIRPN